MTPRRRATVLVGLALSALPWAACDALRGGRTEGERLWRAHCADCHGVDAAGNTPRYMGNTHADLTDDSWAHYGGDDAAIGLVVREGIYGKMPSFESLSPDEVAAIVRHLRVLRGEVLAAEEE